MKFAYASGARPLEGYTIKRGIGVGGFGEVYFALSDAGKEVALKRIQRHLDIELRGVRHCLNLKHPNLIDLYDIRTDQEGESWVVMEYVPGETLNEVLERYPGGVPREESMAWFRGIASGVAYLHENGIVHRDLKPGNVFDDDGVVKIGDYGLSKFISCSRRSGQTESVGTLHYMAPEIGKGCYGKEIDVYALGIVLYELLTGRVPFDGESSQEIVMKHLTAEPDLSAVAEPLRGIVAKALEKDPDDRFTSAGDMLAALELALRTGEIPFAPAPSAVQPTFPDYIGPEHVGRDPHASPFDAPRPRSDDVLVIDDAPPRGKSPGLEPSPTLFISEQVVADHEMSFGPMQETPGARSKPPSPYKPARPAQTLVQRPQPMPRRDAVRARPRWNASQWSTPAKVLAVVAVILFALMNAPIVLPVALVAGAAILVFLGVRAIAGAGAPAYPSFLSPASADFAATAQQRARARRLTLAEWRQTTRRRFHEKSPGERLSELTGSLLMATLVVGVLATVLLMAAGAGHDGSIGSWAFFAWFALTAAAGVGTVLTVSKFWESDEGDPIVRRFLMLVLGLGLGAASFLAWRMLFVEVQLDQLTQPPLTPPVISEKLRDAEGGLHLAGFLVYFGGLLVALRWWRQADPLRPARVSMWAVATAGIWAWVLHLFWTFPQPLGVLLAATIALGVQLSAPWVGPKDPRWGDARLTEASS